MEPTIIAAIISVLVIVLPWLGVQIAPEELTALVQGVVIIVAGIVTWVRTLSLKKSLLGATNVNVFGGVRSQI